METQGLGRRDALRRVTLGGLGAASLPAWVEVLAGLAEARGHEHANAPAAVAADWKPKFLDAHQDETVTVLAELIIPATDTAGGKAALVNRFVDAVLADAEEPERREFLRGLRWLDARTRELFGAEFAKAGPDQQAALLTILSSDKNQSLGDEIGRDFFQAVKAMTITGYYTSEVGMKQELGDDGQVFFLEFKGCTHPEHGAGAPAAGKKGPERPGGKAPLRNS
jgi:glucoside 3-dehydrogenase (cytochrome c) hitch-hiker subunit